VDVHIFVCLGTDEEGDVQLDFEVYWREKDIKELLGLTIQELFIPEVAEPTCKKIHTKGVKKALEWLSENSEADCWIEKQPINGSIDAVLAKRIEKESAWDGPHLQVKEGGKNGKRTMKPRSGGGCRTIIDGVEVTV
jgi:hypothetical protein